MITRLILVGSTWTKKTANSRCVEEARNPLLPLGDAQFASTLARLSLRPKHPFDLTASNIPRGGQR